MIREIQAKTLLAHIKQPDPWFGLKYNMNLYRGCQHQCIYCDSRSTCYGIENLADIHVKVNAIERLDYELSRKRIIGTIGTGSMNDPYMPVEKSYNLTGRALNTIARHRFPVHIITKSDLVIRDLDILKEIGKVYSAVSFSVSSSSDDLARIIEPGAPVTSARFRALQTLAEHGVNTGVVIMPLLPFIHEEWENLKGILNQVASAGASYVIPTFGMTQRTGQREYFHEKLDVHFPGLRQKYESKFGDRYECSLQNRRHLQERFTDLCQTLNLKTAMPVFKRETYHQQSLFPSF